MNRNFGSRTRGLGRRAFEQEVTGDPADGTEVVPPADVVGIDANIAASEVTQLAQEADEELADIDSTAEAIDDIETVADIAEASIPEGGLTPAAAAMARQAVDGAAEKAGVDPEDIVMPATESFGSSTGAVLMTRRAIESWTDEAKKYFDMIIEAIKRGIEWLKTKWNDFVQSGEKLVARADAVAKKAEGSKDLKVKADYKIEKPALAAALAVEGKVDTVAHSADLGALVAKFNGGINAAFATYGKLASSADGIDDAGSLKPELYEAVYKSFDAFCTEKDLVKAPDDKSTVKSTFALPGDKVLGVVVPKEVGADGAAAGAAFGSFNVAMVPTGTEKKVEGALAVLSVEDVIKVAAGAKAIGEAVVKGKDIAANADTELKKVLKTAEGFKDSGEKAEAIKEEEAKKKYKEAVAAVRKIVSKGQKVMQGAPAAFFSYAVSTGNSMLNYADLSLGGLEKAAA